jgi:DNA-binding NtrC family response regulator
MENTEKQTILLIEDNTGDSRLIKELLNEITSFNYQLIIAETLKEGCEQIKKNNYVLILLDLNLPDSTGKDTFDTVIKCAEIIPVVLVSGLHDEQLSLSLIKEGAQDYILKQELNNNILNKTIQFAIERKKHLNEINKKTHQLLEMNSMFTGREMRMIELKKEVNELLIKLGNEKRCFW